MLVHARTQYAVFNPIQLSLLMFFKETEVIPPKCLRLQCIVREGHKFAFPKAWLSRTKVLNVNTLWETPFISIGDRMARRSAWANGMLSGQWISICWYDTNPPICNCVHNVTHTDMPTCQLFGQVMRHWTLYSLCLSKSICWSKCFIRMYMFLY